MVNAATVSVFAFLLFSIFVSVDSEISTIRVGIAILYFQIYDMWLGIYFYITGTRSGDRMESGVYDRL